MVTVFHDLQHKRHPEYFRWFDLPFWKLLLWAAVRRSRGLIAVSQATADDLQRYYGAPRTDSPQVIHHGVERQFFEIAQRREPRDYLLCVSTTHPHKNLERLVARACADPCAEQCRTPAGADRRARICSASKSRAWPRRRWSSPAGFRVSNCTISIAARSVSFIHRLSKASACRCWRRWPPAFRWRAPIFRRCARSRGSTVHFFDPASDPEIRDALLLLASGKLSTEPAQRRAADFSWEKAARATLDYLSKSSS